MELWIGIAAAAAVVFALILGFSRKPKLAEQEEKKSLPTKEGKSAAAEIEATSPEKVEAAETVASEHKDGAEESSEVTPAMVVKVKAKAEPNLIHHGLSNTRKGFIGRLRNVFRGKSAIDDSLIEEMEEVLITADIGIRTADKLLESVRQAAKSEKLKTPDEVWTKLREQMQGILERGQRPMNIEQNKPALLLVVGVNGAGKTTTIGKLASRFTSEGKSVMLAAGDTFRAAAVEQLEVWSERVGCQIVKGKEGSDPSSVIFEAIKKGQDAGVDLVIADTAGRLHTKTPLMDELKKIGRTAEKAHGRPADEILLVLDSTTGQNAIQQTDLFKKALPLSGIALTKLDGTAKGGVILGIVDAHEIPIQFIGIGEKIEDLRPFSAESFIDALFAEEATESIPA